MKRYYFDYASTTPMDVSVLSEMEMALKSDYANPGALHDDGARVLARIIFSREAVASSIMAQAHDVRFLPSATIINNLVINGLLSHGDHLIVSSIEHPSVYETAIARLRNGEPVSFVPVDSFGLVDLVALKNLIKDETRLVSIMMANNEVGTVQPIKKIAEIINECNENRSLDRRIYFHTDAVQAGAYLPIDVNLLGIDLMTLSSHKMYGPKGVACLFIKKNTPVSSIIYGGDQEYGLWSGTENVPAIIGFASATKYVMIKRNSISDLASLRDKLEDFCTKKIKGGRVFGYNNSRLPGILNMSFDGIGSEQLVYSLNALGCSISSVSACSAKAMQPSRVIKAMGFSDDIARSTIRISLGYMTLHEEVEYLMESLSMVVNKLRS